MTVPSLGEFVKFEDVLIDELNVKKVLVGDELAIDTELTPELKREGYAREVVRFVQAARKNAGLNVDDRISLSLETTDSELQEAIAEHKELIAAETLAVTITTDGQYENESTATVDGADLLVRLQKA